MRRLTFQEALVEAVREEMERDPAVFCLGQDIGPFGGALQSYKGLWETFGPERVWEAPISEGAMAGTCIGAAIFGTRPILDISFGEFLVDAMNGLVNHAANIIWGTCGRARLPLVIRTKVGDGPYRGHPQCMEAWFPHIPGLKVVMPSGAADAKGLMKAAIRDDNPVLFFEHMYLYHSVREEIPEGEHLVPIGRAEVKRQGRHVTVAATAWMVHKALAAARDLANDGIDVEILDLRSLAPLDADSLLASVRKTGRLVVAHDAWKVGGFGNEVAAVVAEEAFGALKAPIVRVGAPHVPLPTSLPLRKVMLPDANDVAAAVKKVMGP